MRNGSVKKALILMPLFFCLLATFCQSQEITENNDKKSSREEKISLRKSFWQIFNSKAYAASEKKEFSKEELRDKWEKIIGLDVFFPYFKTKQVEKWAENKASVKVMKVKGKPKFSRNGITYKFKIEF